MDFDFDNVENVFGKVFCNYKYIFNIKKVLGLGWGSLDEVVNNCFVYIVVEVQVWDDYIIDMNFDGEYYFGVLIWEIVFKNKVGFVGIINVSIDFLDYIL